jgi:hypothetical protein
MIEARPTHVASNATLQPMSGLPTVRGMASWLVSQTALTRGVSMLRTLLIVSFLLLAMIAPVWIPVRAIKVLAARPVATRLKEDG